VVFARAGAAAGAAGVTCCRSSVRRENPVRKSRAQSDSKGAAPILIILLTAILVLGCGSPELHVINWRGMRVDVGPDFTLNDEDTVLSAKQLPSEEQKAYGWVTFRWMAPGKPGGFETDRSRCLAISKSDCQFDSTSMAPAECYAVQEGRLADSTFMSSGNCALRDRTIEARYACWNDDCRRVKLIIAQSFASLASGKPDEQKSK